jgi:general secretion pathway protein L
MQMIRDFYEWWIGQLSECIPQRWRQAASSRQDALVIRPVGPLGSNLRAVFVSVWSKGRETQSDQIALTPHDLASLPRPAHLPVVLELADDDVLNKVVILPLATERDLAQVLGFEMDRETPFSLEELFWGYRIAERNRQRGQLTVHLRLITRSSIAPLINALAEAGISPKCAKIAGGPDDGMSLPLQDTDQRKRPSATHILRWAAVSVFAVLAVAAAAAPFFRQAHDLAELDRKIAAGRAAAAEAEQLRNDISRLTGAGNLIKREREAAGDPLVTLAALTGMLPDDTYLTELQQQQNTVVFGGRSAAASRLISAVAADSQLRNPAFVAPVTRMEAGRTEVFSIRAETGP